VTRLNTALDELFERQARSWPLLAKGIEGLQQASTRHVQIASGNISIRHIPHRTRSTTASVDPESVAKRPCFLCPENLFPEQEGLQFGRDFGIYCNPFPIVTHHVTITYREHRPQRISVQLENMLDLAAALPGYFVIYNGPECGASAPDHLHFQAGLHESLPIVKDTIGLKGLTVPNYGRNVFMFHGRHRSALSERFHSAIDFLAETAGNRAEPLINVMVLHEQGESLVYIFPRAKHRPEAFHTGELTVSPASIDLCGVLVVPLARDFEKITTAAIAAIFREVTLADDEFLAVARKLENKR
jgi:ATP adenylyltransferase/5',5'''-P-1,P-4-tetraphosphate phosphorylase II